MKELIDYLTFSIEQEIYKILTSEEFKNLNEEELKFFKKRLNEKINELDKFLEKE